MGLVEIVGAERQIYLRQRKELAELIGYETRNKYEILNHSGEVIGFAAEQQKGFFGFILRQLFGHWRSFHIDIFDGQRNVVCKAMQPFRFFFQRLEIQDAVGRPLGAFQQRFAFFSKKFDVEDSRGNLLMEVSSPLWKMWTFPFIKNSQEVAVIKKRWSGGLTELFTDSDNFLIEFQSPVLAPQEKLLVVMAGLFIDLRYFENKAD